MTCRQFEDAMETVFASADRETLRAQLIKERWDEIAAPDQSKHLSECSDCVQSLLQFLEIRGLVDYRLQPCFHVAYYSADVPDRCLDRHFGPYSVWTRKSGDRSIVIGFCPWCGATLPTAPL
jgi:hypothetical protein